MMVIPSAAEFFTVRKMAVKSERKTERERVLSCKIVGITQPYIKQRNDTLCKLFTTQASQIRLDKKTTESHRRCSNWQVSEEWHAPAAE